MPQRPASRYQPRRAGGAAQDGGAAAAAGLLHRRGPGRELDNRAARGRRLPRRRRRRRRVDVHRRPRHRLRRGGARVRAGLHRGWVQLPDGATRTLRRRTRPRGWPGGCRTPPPRRRAAGVGTHLPGLIYLIALNAIASERPRSSTPAFRSRSTTSCGSWSRWRRWCGSSCVRERRSSISKRRPRGPAPDHGLLVAGSLFFGLYLVVKGTASLVGAARLTARRPPDPNRVMPLTPDGLTVADAWWSPPPSPTSSSPTSLRDEERRQRRAQGQIPESIQRSTLEALGLDPLGAQVRLVYFYDTPDLTFESRGVVVAVEQSPARATTPWSSSGPSCPPSCRATSASRRCAWSRSTPCPAATSARRR